MKKFGLVFLWIFFLHTACQSSQHSESEKTAQASESSPISIVIHGGAGSLSEEDLTEERQTKFKDTLKKAVQTGYEVLSKGGTALDAVEQTLRILEDSPLFNAGKGAVFTHQGTNELDAAIMDGASLKAGAVAGVTTIKNPISLARKVMENSPHVLLSGKGAEQFAKENNIEIVSPSYFYTESRMKRLKKVLQKEKNNKQAGLQSKSTSKFGTVGCVALDKSGNIAAGTSTGGMNNKRWGRIGDSPIIGAGTYANNATCGISATGWGEFFIRGVIAYDISAMIEYKKVSLAEATKEVIQKKLTAMGGTGGVVALNRNGDIAMEFNTKSMFRASVDKSGKTFVAIFK